MYTRRGGSRAFWNATKHVLECDPSSESDTGNDRVTSRSCTLGAGDRECDWQLQTFGGARHGFTNPAQRLNTNQAAFQYDANAADAAWSQAEHLLATVFK